MEALVSQAIALHIFHSLEEDIKNLSDQEQIDVLETLAMEIQDQHGLNATEVYRVVLGTKEQLQTIYLNKESLVEMMNDERNYDILSHKVKFAIENKTLENIEQDLEME